MKNLSYFSPIPPLIGLGLMIVVFSPTLGRAQAEQTTAKDDYVTCWKQPCVYDEGIAWSKKNQNGVAVSVRVGQKAAVTDDQIKQVITNDFKHYGVKEMKFFFEKFKGSSSVIALHVRGGIEGTFGIHNVRDEIKSIAKRAKNTDPLFRSN